MRVYLIRHGMTAGNLKKRYIGKTDEPLCQEGKAVLERVKNSRLYVQPDLLYVSPMRRCMETAQILFPGMEQTVVEDLRECDFGEFENQNYLELAGNENYQKWIDSNGKMPFPGGESREAFQSRSIAAFRELEKEWNEKNSEGKMAVLVVHGGTIMSILERVGIPAKSYYDFQVKNAEGYRLDGENGRYRFQRISLPE